MGADVATGFHPLTSARFRSRDHRHEKFRFCAEEPINTIDINHFHDHGEYSWYGWDRVPDRQTIIDSSSSAIQFAEEPLRICLTTQWRIFNATNPGDPDFFLTHRGGWRFPRTRVFALESTILSATRM